MTLSLPAILVPAQAGPMPQPPVRFMIACAARTGSTMLVRTLRSHPALLVHGDVAGATVEIAVELTALRKVKYGGAAAGESFIYGSYASLRIEEPLSGKVYMNTALKNGEVKLVPSTQTYVDDFPAFYDSVNGLFVKLAEAIDGRDTKWVKAAAAAPDIDKQINDTRELFKLCK